MTAETMYSESQVTLMVANIDEAVRFYAGTLGLRLKARYGNEFAVVEAPGLTIGLHTRSAAASEKTSVSIGLGVESLEAVMEQLSARGVRFPAAIVDDPPVRIAHFTGPGDMALYLVEQSGWR